MPRRTLLISESDMFALIRLLSESQWDQQLDVLQNRLENAEIEKDENIPSNVVRVGSQVQVSGARGGGTSTYTVVFPEDADFAAGKISVLAPLGAALLGRRCGESVVFDVPAGRRRVRIEQVRPPSRGRILHFPSISRVPRQPALLESNARLASE